MAGPFYAASVGSWPFPLSTFAVGSHDCREQRSLRSPETSILSPTFVSGLFGPPQLTGVLQLARARRVELASPFTTREGMRSPTREAGASAAIGNGRLSRRPLFISSAMSLMALNRPREMSAGRPLSWVKLTRFGHRKSAAPDPKETCGPTPRIAYDSDLGVVVPLAFIGLESRAGASRRRAVSQKL